MNDLKGKNKKRKQESVTPGRFVLAMAFLLCFLVAAFFDVWCGVQSRRMGYEIVQAKAQRENLLEFQKKLTIEKARLTSPQLLRKVAADELDLETPKPEQVIIVP